MFSAVVVIQKYLSSSTVCHTLCDIDSTHIDRVLINIWPRFSWHITIQVRPYSEIFNHLRSLLLIPKLYLQNISMSQILTLKIQFKLVNLQFSCYLQLMNAYIHMYSFAHFFCGGRISKPWILTTKCKYIIIQKEIFTSVFRSVNFIDGNKLNVILTFDVYLSSIIILTLKKHK